MSRRLVRVLGRRAGGTVLVSALIGFSAASSGVVCDADTDCFYVPDTVWQMIETDTTRLFPGLLVLHCNGAVQADLDSFRLVGDSLGWVMASCHATRNHRDMMKNDSDIVRTAGKLLENYPVDPDRLFVFGYSGQAVQALAAMFLHPELFRGVVATCGHDQALELAVWETLAQHYAYLVTRARDWNRVANEKMAQAFNSHGLVTELVVTPGEHCNGPRHEVLAGCRWLANKTRP